MIRPVASEKQWLQYPDISGELEQRKLCDTGHGMVDTGALLAASIDTFMSTSFRITTNVLLFQYWAERQDLSVHIDNNTPLDGLVKKFLDDVLVGNNTRQLLYPSSSKSSTSGTGASSSIGIQLIKRLILLEAPVLRSMHTFIELLAMVDVFMWISEETLDSLPPEATCLWTLEREHLYPCPLAVYGLYVKFRDTYRIDEKQEYYVIYMPKFIPVSAFVKSM